MEIWEEVPSYEGKYQVSQYGRVKSISRVLLNREGLGRETKTLLLKETKIGDKSGTVVLTKESRRKKFTIHELVKMAFVDQYL